MWALVHDHHMMGVFHYQNRYDHIVVIDMVDNHHSIDIGHRLQFHYFYNRSMIQLDLHRYNQFHILCNKPLDFGRKYLPFLYHLNGYKYDRILLQPLRVHNMIHMDLDHVSMILMDNVANVFVNQIHQELTLLFHHLDHEPSMVIDYVWMMMNEQRLPMNEDGKLVYQLESYVQPK
ncbi:hypothetical protein RDWZM_009999 [Blomia tropicalis]|uniref:Uncharacterized protein n=1 Tax=Blomia tropicalis TaxID=40697 RepID=A0A9Q0RI94_BLOTA|nr:hypothetical protein RDWZM_009999 [Blomia tropicalis]